MSQVIAPEGLITPWGVFFVVCWTCRDQYVVTVVVELLCHAQLFDTPWTAECQTPLSSTICQSLLKFMSIERVILSNHLILCCSPLLLPSIFPSIRAFSNESALHIRWPKYWSFGISPSNEYWFPLGWNRSRCFSGTPLLSPLSNGYWQFDLWILCLFSTQLVHLKVLSSCTAEAWLERFWA